MCIQFVKQSNDYDFISPLINFTANTAVLAVGGVSLGVITTLALMALGVSVAAVTVATAVTITFGIIGFAFTAVAAGIFIAMCVGTVHALRARK